MRRAVFMLVVWVAGAGVVRAQEPPSAPVDDYEARLEAIGREVDRIRANLDALVAELAAGEMGQAFVFVERPDPALVEGGVRVVVDGSTVVARALLPAERDVLAKGLPLELAALHLPAGVHQVAVGSLDGELPAPAALTVRRGGVSAWIASGGPEGLAWREE